MGSGQHPLVDVADNPVVGSSMSPVSHYTSAFTDMVDVPSATETVQDGSTVMLCYFALDLLGMGQVAAGVRDFVESNYVCSLRGRMESCADRTCAKAAARGTPHVNFGHSAHQNTPASERNSSSAEAKYTSWFSNQ